MLKQALLLLTVAFVGCSTAEEPAVTPNHGTTKQAMVGGTVSSTAQDSVVFLKTSAQGSCTGTLIAPNLVLTAHHCVAEPAGDDECSGFGTPFTPSQIQVKVGASASWENGSVVAKGKKIIVPKTNSGCGFDSALVILDKEIANAKTSPVRFTALKTNEPVTAVGYGIDENGQELSKRMQRNTTVLGVGPTTVAYKMQDGNTFNYKAPAGDVVTGESTCSGDSGGPLFDAKGAVVAMTSRGPFDGPQGGNHGETGCGDMVSIYASTISIKDLIISAAKEAGHPLPAEGGDEEGGLDTQSNDDSDDEAADEDEDSDDEDSDDEDDEKSSSKKKKKSTGAAVTAGGCSSAPGRAGDGWLVVLGVGLALVSAKRRASRK